MKNETAIITGSTSGIGKKMAEIFLKEGCKVAICSRSEEHVNTTLSEFKPEFGDSIIGVPCDVSNPEDLKNLVEKTIAAFGSIRILVANAGLEKNYGPFEYMPPEMVYEYANEILGVNLIGMMNAVAAVLPQMKKQRYGRIITLSGGGAERPLPNMTIYSASKGGVVAFSKCFAEELKESNEHSNDIKINIFQPGMQKTGLTSHTDVVPGWINVETVRKQSELALEYLGGNLTESCRKVLPFVLSSCNKNGKIFRGFKILKMILGGIKLKKEMKKIEQESS
ncbi:MAG: SDR family NAD(P)-dependent oxidoreductase [Candidatus Lokiarchaeota archaeon]